MSPAGLAESPSSLGSLCLVLHVPWRPPGGTPALLRSPWHRRPQASPVFSARGWAWPLLACSYVGRGSACQRRFCGAAPLHFPKIWGAVCRERSFSKASQLFRSLVVRGCLGFSMPQSLLWGGTLWACSPPAPWRSFPIAPCSPLVFVSAVLQR